jgi:hypothetical protein
MWSATGLESADGCATDRLEISVFMVGDFSGVFRQVSAESRLENFALGGVDIKAPQNPTRSPCRELFLEDQHGTEKDGD